MDGILLMIVYVIIFGFMIYFLVVKPQKKQKQQHQQLMESVAKGDFVLTTSGFYGVVIDVTEDDVIVEFGNNKNCRISMQKAAIAQIEKPESAEKSENA